MKRQVLVVHGGTSFDTPHDYIEFIKTRDLTLDSLRCTYDWKASLAHALGDTADVLHPRMPNPTNARYEEWALWFRRCEQLLQDDVILVGHSLGGIFLAKYLSENTFSKRILATILVAAPFNEASTEESLTDFALPDSLELLAQQGGSIYIIQSTDDPIVPAAEAEKYARALPQATQMMFNDRQHCHQETFSELFELISSLS